MGYYVLTEPEEITFERAGIRGRMFPAAALTSEADFTIVETDAGQSLALIEHETDVIYYVLEGDGQFIIDDTPEECHPGNLVIIPQGTKFTYQGRLKMLEICTPPWEESQEEAG